MKQFRKVLGVVTVLAICAVYTDIVSAQDDPVLFSIEGHDVPLSEFEYIYQKNNRKDADYSRKSLTEYLDLYVNFKLKVQRARELQLDTIKALQEELDGYRKQLANTYLNDREVKERLVRQAYERMQWDVHIGHILVKPSAGTPQAEEEALAKIQNIHKRIREGESFEELAQKVSDDKNTRQNGGDLGWVTAMFPAGFYAMENAAYELEPGEISEPFNSQLGYHILKLYEKRPARGEIDAAHILIRVDKDNSNAQEAQEKIKELYNSLQNGVSFETLAKHMSEDRETAPRGGYIGSFGINAYEQSFEDAAFALEENGDFSEPIRTRLGWHIIKRLRKRGPADFENIKKRLEAQINRNERIEIARESMVDRIRKESGFAVDSSELARIEATLDESFLQYQWVPPTLKGAALISFADGSEVSNTEFLQWLRMHTRDRLRMQKRTQPEDALASLMEEFSKEKILEYEEQNLEKKYPDFKALMREYEEGILLFEVTKMAVWDKASQDTAGLRNYYNQHRNTYLWPERLQVYDYTVSPEGADKVDKILKWNAKFSREKLLAKANKKQEILTVEGRKLDREESGNLPWKAGHVTEVQEHADTGELTFTVVDHIIPPKPKSLDEARGYIIADYQDYLEEQWINNLKSRYAVDINVNVLETLIKS